jgi:hypothetical protein
MPYVFFHEYFPEIAERETRSITIPKRLSSGIPAGEYGFLEMYCDERGCDCRRVFFYVISPTKEEPLAVVAYGWENPQFYARWMKDDSPKVIEELRGPILNMGSPQSSLAPAVLELVRDVLLQDELYVERLKIHYRMFRDKVDRKLLLNRRRVKIKKRKVRK